MTGTPKTRPKLSPLIVLDPGHGSGPRAAWAGHGYDPGTVDTRRNLTEAEANVDACLTLKHLLQARGLRVALTHDGTLGAKPDLTWRITMAKALGAAALISVHFDMAFDKPKHLSGVYYAPGEASKAFAYGVRGALIQGERSWVKPSEHSRFKGLYIDAFPDPLPSVLLELDSIAYAPDLGARGKADRLKMLTPVADRIAQLLNTN